MGWVFTVTPRRFTPRTIKVGRRKVGNQVTSLKFSEKKKVVFRKNLEQMFKSTATDLDKHPTPKQQRLT
jgi:hypothetical protein